MGRKKQTGLPAALTKLCQHLKRVAVKNMDVEIAAICDINKLLRFIWREADVLGGSGQG